MTAKPHSIFQESYVCQVAMSLKPRVKVHQAVAVPEQHDASIALCRKRCLQQCQAPGIVIWVNTLNMAVTLPLDAPKSEQDTAEDDGIDQVL